MSLAWTALTPSRTADAIFDLNTATDWTSFREAVSSFAVPAQNIVYADRDGHIGYQAPGLVPIRKSGNDGLQPQEGWRSENDWTGDYVPFEGLPHVLDPDEGFVVTANQAVIGPDYPYHLTDDWDQGYRSQRIRDLLERRIEDAGTLSVADMAEIQTDTRSPLAPVLVPRLLAVDLPRGYWSAGQRQLRHWDFDQPADSAPAEYFNVVWRTLLDLTFHDEMPEDVWPSGGDRWIAVMAGLLDDPTSAWWDDRETPEVETRDDILALAMTEARDQVTKLDAVLVDGWEWGHLHRLDLTEPTLGTSGIGPVEWLVNRGGWEVGGGPAAVDASANLVSEGYTVDVRAVHADGRLARRLRRLPVDQPHRRLRPSVQRPLHRPDRPLGAGRDAPVGLHPRRRRGFGRAHPDVAAGRSDRWLRKRALAPVTKPGGFVTGLRPSSTSELRAARSVTPPR